MICIAIFTVDYVLRMVLVHAAILSDLELDQYPYSQDRAAPWRRGLALTRFYWLQTENIVDLLAIAPFYVEAIVDIGSNAAVVRVFRLVRLFRLFKSPKLRNCGEMFASVIMDAMPALVTLFFLTTLACVLVASCMVFAESSNYSVDDLTARHPTGTYMRPTSDGYSNEVSPFTSIPYAFWWFFVTSTTVGYGDDYPTTTIGRSIAIMTFYLGIVLLALPLTIIGQSFNKFYPQWMATFQSEEENEDDLSSDSEDEDDDQPIVSAQTCLSCGSAFMSDALFCRNCGTKRPDTWVEATDIALPGALCDQLEEAPA
jgi:hypothetical protein